jgi:hypothetical protein
MGNQNEKCGTQDFGRENKLSNLERPDEGFAELLLIIVFSYVEHEIHAVYSRNEFR